MADMKQGSTLPRLAWLARGMVRRMGVPGALGAAVLAAAIVFGATVVWPLAQQSAALERQIAAHEAAGKAPTDAGWHKQSDPAQQLADFYRFFPKIGRASDDLATLHGIAAMHSVQLEQGTYRMVRDRVGKLSLYEITLPVKGEYPQLRKFMSQVLIEIPHLALDGVSFQRQKVGETTLESQIKFTLFLGQAS